MTKTKRTKKVVLRKLKGVSYNAAQLHDEYMNLWSTMDYKPGTQRAAEKTAARLLSYIDRYRKLEALTGVPAAVVMCIHERESNGNWDTYLGNGQSLHRVTTIVPVGRGPFATFEDGAVDAFKLEGFGKGGIQLSDWDEGMLAWWGEKFNGFGYRMKGLRTPYLWGGTNWQQAGKYTSDGHFDPTVMDPQLGMMAVYAEIIRQQPDLNLGGVSGDPAFLKLPISSGIQITQGGVKKLQAALNDMGASPPLVADGWIGDKTKLALHELETKIGGINA